MRRYDILSDQAKDGAALYRLVFTIKAFADFEELAGVPLYSVANDAIKPSDLVAMMFLALQDQHPNITHKEAKSLLLQHGEHGRLKLFNCIARAVGVAPDNNATEMPADFWGSVADMAASLGLAPWEAERFTFDELRRRTEALQQASKNHMEMVAWHACLMINLQLPKDKQLTVDDLLGRGDNAKPSDESPREALERVRREIAESEMQHA